MWIWYSTATDIDRAQPTTEKLKKNILHYNACAMGRAVYEKFGMVMSSTKKSVFWHLYYDLDVMLQCLSESEADEKVS